MDKPVIAVTMGDPCGIGPEIVVRSVENALVQEACIPVIIGDKGVMERAAALVKSRCRLQTVDISSRLSPFKPDSIYIHEVSHLVKNDIIYANPTPASGDAVYRYITAAAAFCQEGKAAAMATAPINKEALNRAGHHYPGHTELLAELTGTDEFVMMLAGDRLRVTLVTIHEPLAKVPELVTYGKVLSTILITHRSVDRYFKKDPRIAVLALNPHGGEGGLFGREEELVIKPAVDEARKRGINVAGPLPADTLFHFAAQGNYDAVVCMYHDQGLIPLKLLHFDDGVNITLGLPIIRTSVDHGTAYDLAGTGSASPESMTAAILRAAGMAGYAMPGN